MKNAMKLGGAFTLATLLAACALPSQQVRSGTQRPGLAVIGAPVGSTLQVDGLVMGDASQYDGRNQVLTIEEGLHTIVAVQHGIVLHSEKIYAVGGETSKVQVGGGTR